MTKNNTKRIETTQGDILVIRKAINSNAIINLPGTYTRRKRFHWFDNFGGIWVNFEGKWYRHTGMYLGDAEFNSNSVTAVDFK